MASDRDLIDLAIARRQAPLPDRRPNDNNPFQVVAGPRPRRTWRDPTGQKAIGNIKNEEKKP